MSLIQSFLVKRADNLIDSLTSGTAKNLANTARMWKPRARHVSPPALGTGMRTGQAVPEAAPVFQRMNANGKNLRIEGTVQSMDQARDFHALLDDAAFIHLPGSMTPEAVARRGTR